MNTATVAPTTQMRPSAAPSHWPSSMNFSVRNVTGMRPTNSPMMEMLSATAGSCLRFQSLFVVR
jgi:hypothetical protein